MVDAFGLRGLGYILTQASICSETPLRGHEFPDAGRLHLNSSQHLL